MASPRLPYVTLRVLDLPMHKTKSDIVALFEENDSEKILHISLAKSLSSALSSSQVATITFASDSPTLRKVVSEGWLSDSEDSSEEKYPTGEDFNGFTPLNNAMNMTQNADLIAITGLGGRAFISWQNIKGQMWLRDLLPADIPELRVITYGFPSEPYQTTSTATLADYTEMFLQQLRSYLSIGRDRPLVLLGHSIGCMMIKDALIKLSASTHFDDIQLFSSVHVVCFFGAPNRGIENHALLQVYGEKRPGQVIRDLGAGSSVLNALNESWIEISKKVKIVSCFELRVTPTVRLMQDDPDGFPQRDGPLALMVSRDSACFYTENETRIPIDLNHSMIAKLTNEPGSAYHSIARTIKAQVQDALKQQELYLQRETPRAALTSRSLSSHGSTLLRYKHLKALGENSCQGSNAGDILASYGLFLATDGEWITENSNTFCRTLLENEQETQTGTLFQDALFKSTCDNFRKKSEAKLIRDMTPLIVPSAEILFLRGASRLGVLIEGVCEIWNTSIPIIRTLPRPSYSLGFTQEAFSDDQLRKLEPFAGELVEESFFKVTDSILFPFLTCEVKCGDLGLDIADSRNMESSSMAVRGLVELFKLVCREKELNHEILSFSVSHDASKVRIYGHYAVTNGPRTSYHRHALRKFDIMALGGKDKWSAYQFTRNLYDMWAPLHLQRIRTAIDELEFSTSL